MSTTATRGRPRTFTDDEVLDVLIQLFWQQGYEATSINDIVAATGLNKSSLYNTFGSKEQLFERALSRYVDTRSALVRDLLVAGTAGIDDLNTFFDAMKFEVEAEGGERGCLAVNTSTELGQRDDTVVAISSRYRSIMRTGFEATLRRAGDRGEIDVGRVEQYASVLVSFLIGTAVIVRSGADVDEIFGQIESARAMVQGWRLPETGAAGQPSAPAV